MKKFAEKDMYEPIRSLLAREGFIVRGEVKGCDIAAVREGQLWIVEMKLSANITLIYQAMARQTATPDVFIAIPRPKNARDKNFKSLQSLLKKLGLGLITVALDSPAPHAETILFPNGKSKSTKQTFAIKNEILNRTSDTTGGINKAKVNTAYREKCIAIACILCEEGQSTTRDLLKKGTDKNTSGILRANYYGWYKKVEKGVFMLSEAGKTYLSENKNEPLVAYYSMKAKEII
jgi:hypothetical protein